jgi:hypothetical protein
MKISVTYEDSDVAKILESIINHTNSEEIIKLLTPMLCNSNEGIQHFFKILTGNKLFEVIPNGTLCYMPIQQLEYNANVNIIKNSDLCVKGNVIVTVKDFRGYHEYSTYSVEYINILSDGTRKKDITYTSNQHLDVIKEF